MGHDIEFLLKQLASPAQRAIQSAGIHTLEQLSSKSESEVAAWHGIGPSALEVIHAVLSENGLALKN